MVMVVTYCVESNGSGDRERDACDEQSDDAADQSRRDVQDDKYDALWRF
jgi:hypothetical protein